MFSSEISPVTDLWGQAFRRFKISSGEGKTVFYWGQIKYLVNGFTFLSERKKQKITPLAVLTANTVPDHTAFCSSTVKNGSLA